MTKSRIMEFPEEIRLAESNSEQLGVTRIALMENAGVAVANVARRIVEPGSAIIAVCGSGNNGGDGLVAARLLLQEGDKVAVFLLSTPSQIKTEESRANWNEFERIGGRHFDASDPNFLRHFAEELGVADVVIDAIFGTGISGEITGLPADVISMMNGSQKRIVAVDAPSGLDPFSGRIAGTAVRADFTVTFHMNKKGLVEKPEYTGTVEVKEIGIPSTANLFISGEDLQVLLKPRPRFSHKGDYGAVLIVGGSNLYHGAPALAALAALRTGCGLSFIGAPESVAPSIRAISPDLIVNSLPGAKLMPRHLDLLKDQFDRATVIALGPGLGRDALTLRAVSSLFEYSVKSSKSVILDADALEAINATSSSRSDRVVVTPHAGEFERMAGVHAKEFWRDRLEIVRDFSLKRNCTTLLKGHHTVVSDGRRIRVYRGGNPGMAKGGVGDVLTGVIAGLVSQGLGVFDAACMGSYILGEAANNLFEKMGFHFIASDLISMIPEIMKQYDMLSEE